MSDWGSETVGEKILHEKLPVENYPQNCLNPDGYRMPAPFLSHLQAQAATTGETGNLAAVAAQKLTSDVRSCELNTSG